MSDRTAIEWAANADGTPGATWNPLRARNRATGKVGWFCVHESEGCRNCYAERINVERFGNGVAYKAQNESQVEIFLDEKTLMQPLRWKKPRTIFVCSMSDLFGAFVSDALIDKVFAIAALCPQHTFIVLTKRAKRMREHVGSPDAIDRVKDEMRYAWNSWAPDEGYAGRARFSLPDAWTMSTRPCFPDCSPPCALVWQGTEGRSVRVDKYDGVAGPQGTAGAQAGKCFGVAHSDGPLAWPLPNVWLGVSAEDQKTADARIPDLLATPAAIRFVSLEPLLGPIDATPWLKRGDAGLRDIDPLAASMLGAGEAEGLAWVRPALDWVIVGGESGPNARPMHPDWARDLRDQCAAAGVPYFFKQWGEHVTGYLDGDEFHVDEETHGPRVNWRGAAKCIDIPTESGHYGRVGKAGAGRLLDGVEHNARPPLAQGSTP